MHSKISDFTKKNYLNIALAVFIGVISIWGTFQYNRARMLERAIENMYEMSFYELVNSVSSLDVKLSKLIVTASSGESIELLNQISNQTKTATSNLATLPASHPAVSDTMAFLNLLGDYSRSLIGKTGDGESLSDESYENLQNMRNSCITILEKLNYMNASFQYDPKQDYYESADTPIDVYMVNEEENDYPTLIYDGPFSEGLKTASPKGLTGDYISREQGLSVTAKALKCSTSKLEYISDINNKIECYMYEKTDDVKANCAITKIGGKLLWMIKAQQRCGEILSEEECERYANVFLKEQGINNAISVWMRSYDGQMVINMAPVVNGIIIYPDLIKIKINMQTGDVLSYDTTEFYMNNHQRTMENAAITQDEAIKMLSPRLEVNQARMCLIPTPGGNEMLCYEFVCKYNEEIFYIFINAQNGLQEKIFKEVATPDGSLVV